MTRWPEEEMGRNSVRPSTRPRTAAVTRDSTSAPGGDGPFHEGEGLGIEILRGTESVGGQHAGTVGADHEAGDDLGGAGRIDEGNDGPVVYAALELYLEEMMHFFELAEHDVAVFAGLHVAVGGTAYEHEPVSVGVDGEGEIGAAEVQNAAAAVFSFVRSLLEHADEIFEHIHAGGKEELFLVAIVMGEQAEGDAGTVDIQSRGMYSNSEKEMIFLVVPNKDVPLVQSTIRELDPTAFIVVTDAYDTFGEGFKPLPSKDEIQNI